MSIWEKQDPDDKRSAFDKITNRPGSKVLTKPITKGQMIFKSEYASTDGFNRMFITWQPRTSYKITRIKVIMLTSQIPRLCEVRISDPVANVGALKAADFVTIPDGITYVDPGDGCVQGPSGQYWHIFNGGDTGLTRADGINVQANGAFDADYPENLILRAGKSYDISVGSLVSWSPLPAPNTETMLFLDYEQIPA